MGVKLIECIFRQQGSLGLTLVEVQQNSRSYNSREPASTMLGFGACVHTQIQILNIAPGFNTVVVSRHLSKMKSFIKECNTFRTSAWLTAPLTSIAFDDSINKISCI